MTRWPCAFIIVLCASAADLRQDVLHAIFPGTDVVATTRHRNDGNKDSPDALSNEPIFQINGPAANDEERCASEDLRQQRFSNSREVRLVTFPWPQTRADVLAVIQYRFIGASPAGACWSIGLLAHLTRRGGALELVEQRLVAPHHHSKFAGIRLLDLTGSGAEQLVVESNWGGAGSSGVSLLVFDLSGRRFRQILQTQSHLEYLTDDRYHQVLDAARTLQQSGRAICFELTQYAKGGTVYRTPHVSHECYPVGTGVEGSDGPSRLP